jgi:predicted dehydrogenase
VSIQLPSRRRFLRTATCVGAGVTIPYFFSSARTLADVPTSENDRVKIGLIGAGSMGSGNMVAASQWCDVVAIADVDTGRGALANNKLSDGKADVYSDYRKILERKDLDALHIATPDHWHAKVVVESLKAGFDVYCEKPLTLTIDEGKLIRQVVKDTNRIVQVGTQQRSTFQLFVKAIAMVAEGRLGRIRRIEVAIGGGPTSPNLPAIGRPKDLDWDRWLGPAPVAAYRQSESPDESGHNHFTNGHYNFRWWYQYSGGKLTDWGAHHVDIALWALRSNGQTGGLLKIGGEATHPVPFKNGYPEVEDRYNTATNFLLKAEFPGGTEFIIRDDTRNGVLIEGDEGTIFVCREFLSGRPVDDLTESPLPEDAIQRAYLGFPMVENERKAHWANFFHCVRERRQPISSVDSHMDALNVCHLAGISARLGRTLAWDSSAEQIIGDDEANQFLSRPYRTGYEIEV